VIAAFPAAAGQRVGLLGGSFNPAHRGHLAISLAALRLLALDRVVWLVSPQNPLKAKDALADYEARVQSAATMTAAHPRIFVSRFEAEQKLRYSADTIAALKRIRPRTHFVFLMGADNLVSFARWKNWTALFCALPIAVFARPGWDLAAPASQAAERFRHARLPLHSAARLALTPPPAWVYVPFTHDETSATAIRQTGEWPPRRA
jgi:nicotinate-nucleotide adenylyltransferase